MYLTGEMFGNLVNKNARAALKEYGDHNGASVEFDISPSSSAQNPEFIAKAIVGEQQFPPATASSKKDAKEHAADIALQAIFQGKMLMLVSRDRLLKAWLAWSVLRATQARLIKQKNIMHCGLPCSSWCDSFSFSAIVTVASCFVT